ncbi:Ig-like domain-containing protein [Herbaspirillum sp. LeCh32-8]|uniref:Ig-like domain-containing alpha-2-macroglobulin family protein n=1 Tax=Herbaspirillum sp. LeCh32-8 TaxID=2821356 RepID=UPI001AE73B4B|nr:Ig-like domain-containing alpha-2-macroglobulin family protein [Herbaspirillum sp. LeCh32-8]MBP0599586.1 Ig-like domain-containing protein [Herbaspirillum sp. LeCh32-8]
MKQTEAGMATGGKQINIFKQAWQAWRSGLLALGMAAGLALPAGTATAANAGVVSFSPQGEVARIRQVRARFSEPMVKFGDPKAASPFDVDCSVAGTSRWADDKNWVFDFERDLPPGTRCSFNVRTGIKSVAGNTLGGKGRFQFSTGGPAVVRAQPYNESQIAEDQAFILFQNGAATEASVRDHLYCEAEGINERIPTKAVGAADRKALLSEFAKGVDPATVTIVQCQQRLPNEAHVKLVWDRGIAAANAPAVVTSQPQVFKFQVRSEFNASFSCQRENANAACSPILPVTLSFSSPVPRKLAEQVTLNATTGKIKPTLDSNQGESVRDLSFKPPFPEKSDFTITLPSGFQDEDGRSLGNASSFPLKSALADFPPLAKFPAAPFGIIELNADPTLPVTLRRVEAGLQVRGKDGRALPGKVADLKVDGSNGDKGVIAWLTRLNKYHEKWGDPKKVDSRSVSLLSNEPGAKKLDLPALKDAKDGEWPFEVIGIPLKDPGFYVVELESQKLGASLLGKPQPMYVRTSALVTNMAVHVKLGRANGAVWVTRLDNARPVADAEVRVSNCDGVQIWQGKTDARGVAVMPALEDACANRPYSAANADSINGLFVSARKTDEKGRADMAFALSSWNDGIESWRFNLPTDTDKAATTRATTVFDRSLFRAGETVSMKHVIRTETMQGFGLVKKEDLPTRLRITHQGSGQEYQFALNWRGNKSAETSFPLPKEAKLGTYQVTMDQGKVEANSQSAGNNDNEEERGWYGRGTYYTGTFRVEEFRLPLMQGRITPPKGAQVAVKELPLDLQLNYINGGAANQQVRVSSLLRARSVNIAGYDGFSFAPPRADDDSNADDQKIVADKLPVTLDKNGAGRAVVGKLPASQRAQELLTEMSYNDPNGEVQTISSATPLWPSAVVVGLRAGNWISVRKKLTLSAVTLDTAGKPQAGVPVEISGTARQTNSHRKRMVGGFYAYENDQSSKDLGKLCSGKSDQHGMFICDIELAEPGNVDLVASASDAKGNAARASSSVWVTGRGELWFDGENQDRIDILAEKKNYQPGETAKFQVRMPFRYATALVAVEREGVIDTQVVQLSGQDPTVSVPVKAEYGPNVYVSVLAVRGRMREVPWYSFFIWGWKEPINWWHEFREYQGPGPIVDLSKPAWKYGIAEINVGDAGHKLQVTVSTDKPSYPIRATAKVQVQVKLPDGKPAAGAEFALAAVDEALLELQPNTSWDVLHAMLQRRSYGVETSTAQMQVVGKRHYGKKATPAGGGGGRAPTRELFDTLLLWKPSVVLDAEGRATLEVPLNDALTSFRIVAVAESGTAYFGTGSVNIRSTQDVQLISGLPPLVREGDSFNGAVTVRNTTAHDMKIKVSARAGAGAAVTSAATALNLPEREVAVAAGQSAEVVWPVQTPEGVTQLAWEISAQEQGGQRAKDAMKFTQRVAPAVPVTVQQATLFQLDKSVSLPISQPAGNLPGRGGLAVALKPSLAGGSEALTRYFADYPFSCLEQKTSKAIGLRDEAGWQKVAADLPTYLDGDGLAYYFPPSDSGARRGSDTLTAYLLAATSEAGYAIPQASRDKMLDGLASFVEGRITRDFWSPQKDLDVRKLAALEALSRFNRVQPSMLGSLQINPNQWPTSGLLDWVAVLQRVPAIPERQKKLDEAEQILRARLNFQGTRMGFSNEEGDYWWWLMSSGDANANRLILLELNNPAWREDMPRLVAGAISRQQRGHWGTTTANVWGSLALEKFARKFESEPVTGSTRATVEQGGASVGSQTLAWGGAASGGKLQLPWPKADGAAATARFTQEGSGRPWVTLQSLAAVPLKQPFSSGYRIVRKIEAVEQKQAGVYTRGDVLRVTLDIDAQTDMTWVVVSDPVPGGATLLGSGLGRDSVIAQGNQDKPRDRGLGWMAYEERSFEAYRAYYESMPKGRTSISYTVRLNNAGEFNLPPTRVEAMYAPEMFGEIPNQKIVVKAAQ